MFFYEGMKSNMTCALKVDTRCKGWYETTSKILRKIGGLSYDLDAKEEMIYISGKVDPQKILKKVARHGKNVELCWIKTGDQYMLNNNNVMDHCGTAPMPASAYPYVEPPYHRGFCPECPPPPPPPPMPYYQYHNYEPIPPPLPPRYPPQLPYYY